MNRFATVLAFAITLAAPANAFTLDLILPNLTFPDPVETTQACIQPAQIGTPGCPAPDLKATD